MLLIVIIDEMTLCKEIKCNQNIVFIGRLEEGESICEKEKKDKDKV